MPDPRVFKNPTVRDQLNTEMKITLAILTGVIACITLLNIVLQQQLQ